MATVVDDLSQPVVATADVYVPQQDSQLLIRTVEGATPITRRRTVDLCTSSGVIAIAAARLGGSPVTAWNISAHAIRCARDNARTAGVSIDARMSSSEQAITHGPYDVVVAKPPYVPTPPDLTDEDLPVDAGPALAFSAGPTVVSSSISSALPQTAC